jgi:hypothetical protein
MGEQSHFGRKLAFASLGLVLMSTVAAAGEIISCRSQADAAADEWADGRIYPVGPADEAGPDQVTVISYGKKYVVPRHHSGTVRVVSQGLGGLAAERNQVYVEELNRCLRPYSRSIRIYLK